MKTHTKPIEELNGLIDSIITILGSTLDNHGWEKLRNRAVLCTQQSLIKAELDKRFAEEHFKNMMTAMGRENSVKAMLHAKRVKKQIIPVANDYPFSVGQNVWVNRYEHGWNPGWEAKIKEVHQYGAIYSYTATVIEGGKHQFDITIDHTRDASHA